MMMMNIHHLILMLLVSLIASCATVPITGRRQLMIISESMEISEGNNAYRGVLRQSVISDNSEARRLVRKVGERIARVANKPNYKWEFTVIDEPKMANAFAVPGGKVAVYTGIFPVAKDEVGLAVVLGHEVAHALARHGAERISQRQLLQIPTLVGTGFGVDHRLLQAYGMGAAYGIILPFSRSQELEADRIGLRFMAQAGYDPRASLELWKRMEEKAVAQGKGAPPSFMSTHPGYEKRTQQLRAWIPEALKFYRTSRSTPELLPSLDAMNSPQTIAERALLKKMGTINKQARNVLGQKAILQALGYRISRDWKELFREIKHLRVNFGEYSALRGTAYLTQASIRRIVGSYKKNASWTEITQRRGIKMSKLISFMTDLIRLHSRWR